MLFLRDFNKKAAAKIDFLPRKAFIKKKLSDFHLNYAFLFCVLMETLTGVKNHFSSPLTKKVAQS
jgi:hypothetical protein